jgi:hypothetical protein
VVYQVLLQIFISMPSYIPLTCRHLFAIGAYGQDTPITQESLPTNLAAEKLAAGLAQAHKAYGIPNAAILFVVQEPERNAFDQRWLEYHLLKDHQIHTCRMTFQGISSTATLDHNRTLVVTDHSGKEKEISVVYLRAGYGPGDYPTMKEWQARKLLEQSRAIKCPTIITQLAGCKKVQQVLTTPGVLERHILTFID